MRLRKINQTNNNKGRTTSKETNFLPGFNLHISGVEREIGYEALSGSLWNTVANRASVQKLEG